jgi:sec-independent protein translocase protein TatC
VARVKNPEKKMGLGGHLRELRTRLYWSALYILIGSVAGWFLFDFVYNQLIRPLKTLDANPNYNVSVNFGTVVGAFDLRFQMAIFLGVIFSSPFWLYHVWRFSSPAMKKRERRYTLAFLLTASPLFLAGCALAWYAMPTFVIGMLSFTPTNAASFLSANEYILFTLRLLLVFGIAFVLPVILVFLNFLGVVSGAGIRKSWRLAIFISVLIAALATPVSDPMSMLLVSVPLIIFYFIAMGIALARDKRKGKAIANLDEVRPLEEI